MDARHPPEMRIELRIISLGTEFYMGLLRGSFPIIEASGERYGWLRDLLISTLDEREMGTPASIAAALRELQGSAT
jgi:hypothetical protein